MQTMVTIGMDLERSVRSKQIHFLFGKASSTSNVGRQRSLLLKQSDFRDHTSGYHVSFLAFG